MVFEQVCYLPFLNEWNHIKDGVAKHRRTKQTKKLYAPLRFVPAVPLPWLRRGPPDLPSFDELRWDFEPRRLGLALDSGSGSDAAPSEPLALWWDFCGSHMWTIESCDFTGA